MGRFCSLWLHRAPLHLPEQLLSKCLGTLGAALEQLAISRDSRGATSGACGDAAFRQLPGKLCLSATTGLSTHKVRHITSLRCTRSDTLAAERCIWIASRALELHAEAAHIWSKVAPALANTTRRRFSRAYAARVVPQTSSTIAHTRTERQGTRMKAAVAPPERIEPTRPSARVHSWQRFEQETEKVKTTAGWDDLAQTRSRRQPQSPA